jgi:hypothetical protein
MSGESHPDVEFVVSADGAERSFETFTDALEFAFSIGVGEPEVTLDVLVYSEEGAEWYGGDEAVRTYQEDPEASVLQRYQIRIANLGRVA